MEDSLGLPPGMSQSAPPKYAGSHGSSKGASSARSQSKYKFQGKKSPKPQQEVVSGIDREELNAVVAQEMEGLMLFIKGVSAGLGFRQGGIGVPSDALARVSTRPRRRAMLSTSDSPPASSIAAVTAHGRGEVHEP